MTRRAALYARVSTGEQTTQNQLLRLREVAKGDDAEKREGAIRTLKFMKEQGVLLALRNESGPTGELAASAYHELMNPVVEMGGVIKTDDKNAEDKDPLENMR